MKKCRLFIMMLAVVLCSGNLMDAQAASENGNLGITITIDGSTNDETINIEIPADWV